MADSIRSGAEIGINSCREAGVHVKMIMGDNVYTAQAIATGCGILEADQAVQPDTVVEGSEFRNYTPEQRLDRVDIIRVMARSSPSDKLLMVQCLKEKGHIVAVTGDVTNDASTLKEAHVGLSVGSQGTKVAKENSDIVILGEDFTSIRTIINDGRSFYNNVQKFIQYQLTITISSLFITLFSAALGHDVPLTVFQSLFVEMMGKLAALVASERPLEELMHNPPVGCTETLVTNVMWRNLLAQAVYQIAAHLILIYIIITDVDDGGMVQATVIYNTFVLSQVCNLFNSRMFEKKNVFKGIHKSKLFLGVIGGLITMQVLMVQFLGNVTGSVSLSWAQWGICVAIALVTLPLGMLIKLVPVPKTPFRSYFTYPCTQADSVS